MNKHLLFWHWTAPNLHSIATLTIQDVLGHPQSNQQRVCDNHLVPSPESCSTAGDAKGEVPPSTPCCAPSLQYAPILQCLLLPLAPGSVVQRKRPNVFNFQAHPVTLLFHIPFFTFGLCRFFGGCCSFFCPSNHLLHNKSFSPTFTNSLDYLISMQSHGTGFFAVP